MSDKVREYLENKEEKKQSKPTEKQLNPTLWKPLGIKPLTPEEQYLLELEDKHLAKTHSFLETQTRDINTDLLVDGFSDHLEPRIRVSVVHKEETSDEKENEIIE